MIRALSFFLLFAPCLLLGEVIWKGKANDRFSVEIVISQSVLSLDETLIVTAKLQFPETYSVDTDKLRTHLLKFAGLSEPPFALLSEKEENIPGGRQVTLELDPLLEGYHFISFYDVLFLPKEAEKDSPVEIITDIFEIETTAPETEPLFRGITYPLLSLTKRFPISLSPDNRIDFVQNPELQQKESERNESILKEKTFPIAQVVGVLLFIILLLIARMQPQKVPDKDKLNKKRAVSSRKKALKALKVLKEKGPSPENALDAYFIYLTNTLKKYIEERYQIKATTRTTTEFLESMANYPAFDEKTKELLKQFLTNSDRVKFAEYNPSPEEIQSAYFIAKQLVEYTPNPSKY